MAKKKTRKKPRVYLAGRITDSHWRSYLSDKDSIGWRNEFETISGSEIEYRSIEYYYDYECETDKFIVTGPHSIGCDHSCFHQGKHASADAYCCCADVDISKADVLNACSMQIEKSDFVFAYIEDLTAYGTFAEIGYAYAIGKPIYILFDNEKLLKPLWFIREMATESYLKDFTKYTAVEYDEQITGIMIHADEMIENGKCIMIDAAAEAVGFKRKFNKALEHYNTYHG